MYRNQVWLLAQFNAVFEVMRSKILCCRIQKCLNFHANPKISLTNWHYHPNKHTASTAWWKTSSNWLGPPFHRRERESVCSTFVMNGMKMSVLLDVRTLVSSLTGVGRIIGICPWLQNYNDYMWHWTLWLQARRTGQDHAERKEPQCSHSRVAVSLFHIRSSFASSHHSLLPPSSTPSLVLTKSVISHSLHLPSGLIGGSF